MANPTNTDLNTLLMTQALGTLQQTQRLDYDGSNNAIYVGNAAPGSNTGDPVWQIKQLNYDGSGNLISVLFPAGASGKGPSDFAYVWTSRAGYTYA